MLLQHHRRVEVARAFSFPRIDCGLSSLRRVFAVGVFSGALAGSVAGAQAPTRPQGITLREVLDSVRIGHPLIEAARARVRGARGARVTAGAIANPILSYDVENARLPGRVSPPMDRETMTTAMIPLEALYQRAPRARRANAEIRAAQSDANVQRQRVALDAVHAYHRTAVAQIALHAALDLVAWLDTVVAYNRARVDEGVAAEADLIRSELERDRAVLDATMDEAELARARAELASFLGASVGAPLAVAIDSAPLVLQSGLASDLISSAIIGRAIDTRPEIHAARDRVASANAGIASERSMLVRQLGVTLGMKQSVGATSMMAGFSVPLPLFDQNRGEIVRATSEREAATFELAAEERSVRAQVAGALEAARVLTIRVTALTQPAHGYLARADESRRIALGAYREGAVPLMQVIDAARAWGEARGVFYRTLYAQHESVLELLAAQGVDITTGLPSDQRSDEASGSRSRQR